MKSFNQEVSTEKTTEIEKKREKYNKETYKKKLEKNKKRRIIIPIISVSILIFVLLLCTGFALFNINNNKVISKVSIKSINVSGLTRKEVENKLNKQIQEKLEENIILKVGDFEYPLKLSQIEVVYNTQEAVEEAYNVGRKGNIVTNNFEILKTIVKGKDINLKYEYNDKLLNDVITDISLKIPDAVMQPSYYIEENKLYIVKGKAGNTIDKENLKNKIIDIIKNNNQKKEINIDEIKTEPELIDIEKIYNEIHKEPKDAYYTKEPFQIYPHEDGIDFDINKAKELLKENKEEYEIELIITKPKITTGELGTEAFPDLLSSFSTKYDASNGPRTNNLILAMKSIDGVVVNPGEVFSYNKTLGRRTIAGGYKEAGGFAGGRVVQLVGGGICQISSTLYNAVIYANLEIVERYNHMFLAGYVGAGKDATVSYGTLDFKFKNTRKYPIIIKTAIGSGVAKVSIFGIKEEAEYEIEISTKVLNYTPYSTIYEDDYTLPEGQEKVEQYGMNGCKSITYKIVKLNGQQISSNVLSTDTYDPMNKIVKRGAKKIVQTNTEPEPVDIPEQEQEPSEPQMQEIQEQQETQKQPEEVPQEEVVPIQQTDGEKSTEGNQ